MGCRKWSKENNHGDCGTINGRKLTRNGTSCTNCHCCILHTQIDQQPARRTASYESVPHTSSRISSPTEAQASGMNLDTGTTVSTTCRFCVFRSPFPQIPPANPSLSHDYAAHSCTARRVQLPCSVSCRGIKLQARALLTIKPMAYHAMSTPARSASTAIEGRPPERTATAYIGDSDATISERVVQQATEHNLRKRH